MKSIKKLLEQETLSARELAILEIANLFNMYGQIISGESTEPLFDMLEVKSKAPAIYDERSKAITKDYFNMYSWLQFQLAVLGEEKALFESNLDLITTILRLIAAAEGTETKILAFYVKYVLDPENKDKRTRAFLSRYKHELTSMQHTFTTFFAEKNTRRDAEQTILHIVEARRSLTQWNAITTAIKQVYQIPNADVIKYKLPKQTIKRQKEFAELKKECIEHFNIRLGYLPSEELEEITEAFNTIFNDALFSIAEPTKEMLDVCTNYFSKCRYPYLTKENQEIFEILDKITPLNLADLAQARRLYNRFEEIRQVDIKEDEEQTNKLIDAINADKAKEKELERMITITATYNLPPQES